MSGIQAYPASDSPDSYWRSTAVDIIRHVVLVTLVSHVVVVEIMLSVYVIIAAIKYDVMHQAKILFLNKGLHLHSKIRHSRI